MLLLDTDEVNTHYDLIAQMKVVRVRHAQFPHGIVLTHRAGWKLVYSGDTMPCQNLVDAGWCCLAFCQ